MVAANANAGKKNFITVNGTVTDALPGAKFKVQLDNGHEIIAHLSGNMRRNYIRILLGDTVQLEISPYDLTKGRIVYRGIKTNTNPTHA